MRGNVWKMKGKEKLSVEEERIENERKKQENESLTSWRTLKFDYEKKSEYERKN